MGNPNSIRARRRSRGKWNRRMRRWLATHNPDASIFAEAIADLIRYQEDAEILADLEEMANARHLNN